MWSPYFSRGRRCGSVCESNGAARGAQSCLGGQEQCIEGRRCSAVQVQVQVQVQGTGCSKRQRAGVVGGGQGEGC